MTRCAIGHPLAHVVEERRDLRFHAHADIGLARLLHVLRPRLLRHDDAKPHVGRQQRKRARHELGEGMRALAAAEDEEAERLVLGIGGSIEAHRLDDRPCAPGLPT